MKKDKIIDFYLNNALILDAILIGLIWGLNSNLDLFNFTINTKENNISILSDIISASISLAGFILASLTIIAAIRSNITNKAPETAKNPLELFFSARNYKSIIIVFRESIIELTFAFVLSYIIWLSLENITNFCLFKIIISLLILISLSVSRSLLVLFKIININDDY